MSGDWTAQMSEQARAVVIGLDCLQGLQTARILAARGVGVIGVAKDPAHHACRTKVCEEIVIADTGGVGLVTALARVGPGFVRKPVLFPCQDKNVAIVSAHRAELEQWYEIVLPPHDVVEMMMDKARFYEFAMSRGFPLVPTYMLDSAEAVQRAAAELAYPAILKPSLRLREWSKYTREKAFIVGSAQDLIDHYERMRTWTDVLIAQEFIPGPESNHFTTNCYFGEDGEALVTFTTRKIRQWPPGTGQACLSEEAENQTVVKETLRVFGSVPYRGLAYLEMKRDERTGAYYIIEPNIGRPTGRSASAEAAGVELIYTMYCDALGLDLPTSRFQTFRNVKWIHLMRDLQASVHHMRRGELTVGDWWRSVRGRRAYAIASWRDPLPFLAALLRVVPTIRSTRGS